MCLNKCLDFAFVTSTDLNHHWTFLWFVYRRSVYLGSVSKIKPELIFCSRRAEVGLHQPPRTSGRLLVRTSLHLQAAAAIRDLGLQRRDLLLGRNELHNRRQVLQQDAEVRLRRSLCCGKKPLLLIVTPFCQFFLLQGCRVGPRVGELRSRSSVSTGRDFCTAAANRRSVQLHVSQFSAPNCPQE